MNLFVFSGMQGDQRQSMIYVALDQNYISKEEFGRIYKQAEKMHKIVDGLIRYLKKNKKQPH